MPAETAARPDAVNDENCRLCRLLHEPSRFWLIASFSDSAVMDVDSVSKKTGSKKGRGKIEKRGRKKNSIVFPKANKKRGKTGKK